MSRHSFDPQIAEKVGVNAAVIYQNIVFWAEHKMNNRNRSSDRHFWHDGYWWTYNSRSAFSEQFSYFTTDQIRTSLDKLVKCGLLQKGNYNKAGFDKTNWYAPTISADWPVGEKSPMDGGSEPNALGEIPQPIPDSKPNTKPNRKLAREARSNDLFSEDEKAEQNEPKPDSDFDEFWKVYPKKEGKPAARKAWVKATKRETPQRIIAAAKRYADWLAAPAKPGEFKPHPKYPQGWLNDDRWEAFQEGNSPSEVATELTKRQHDMLADGVCPPSLKGEDGKPNAAASYWLKRFGHEEHAA